MYGMVYSSPVGPLSVRANDKFILELEFGDTGLSGLKENKIIEDCRVQLDEYFSGVRRNFDIDTFQEGTEFQLKVWEALKNIPYGETKSYKEIAEFVNCPKGFRAVGNANNKNKIAIIIPCHRVIGVNNKMVGFAGGIKTKEFLLELERENKTS